MNATSKVVWREGWQREAAATQAASAKVAAFIGLLEQRGYGDSAGIIRQMAMRHGVRAAEAALRATMAAITKNPGTSI
jgi:hypothetical protein